MPQRNNIRMVVFDWAGTTVDHGCLAPVAAFVRTFAKEGLHVTNEQVRGPMGLHKKDHIRRLLEMEGVTEQWQTVHGRMWTEDDVERMFREHFIPLQLAVIEQHTKLIPGLLDCVSYLLERDIKICTTTGYFLDAANIVYQRAAEQGYVPDANLCAEEVPVGRPAPWMMYRHMERFNIAPPNQVVKVGDTVADILEGRNAGAWSVGVTKTSSEIGLTEEEFQSLSAAEQLEKLENASNTLRNAGAHFVIDSVAQFPELLDQIRNGRL